MHDAQRELAEEHQKQEQRGPRLTLGAFTQRAVITGTVAVAAVLMLAFLWYAGNVLLLIFSAILVGVFLRGLSDLLQAHTRLSPTWSLTVVVLVLLILFGLSASFFAASIIEQSRLLVEQLPQATQQARQRLEQYSWGQQLLQLAPQAGEGGQGGGGLLSAVTGFFTATLSGLVNFVVVLIVGLYLAADPGTYTGGLVRLLPKRKRKRAYEVLGALGFMLRRWLIGRFVVMAANGALTGLALSLLGIPLALVLGLLTGILNFVPNIGPILAGIPAVLLAFTEGPNKVLWVVALFIVIQNLEGFVLTPLVEEQTVALPAAAIILSQVLLGVLFGSLGVLLATPITASVLVLVKLLYIEDVLGDPADVPGQHGT